ncbi:lysophospholipid acyltransferase family protein [Gemmatimonas sp.]|uniref:lysophospholipid acyltransferase family protein n=1 Tax=Gemmatimonas sp. TaxID=1962908 RepID=UPI0037BF8579
MSSPVASASAPSPAPRPTDSATVTHPWRLGPDAPQSHKPWLRALGWFLMQRAGWSFSGQMPNLPKFVCIVAPHTSNWDFPVGLAAKWALGFDAHWWGKDTLFTPPLGWFMRANGGIPVVRSNKNNAVERTVELARTRLHFALALAPEGTRKKVSTWRSGFWHVAKGAGIPIVLVALDWEHKLVRLGPTVTPDEDDPADGIARIRAMYEGIRGYDPSRQG